MWMRVVLPWIPQEITDTAKEENDAMPVKIGMLGEGSMLLEPL